jgi:hypothetical protein
MSTAQQVLGLYCLHCNTVCERCITIRNQHFDSFLSVPGNSGSTVAQTVNGCLYKLGL